MPQTATELELISRMEGTEELWEGIGTLPPGTNRLKMPPLTPEEQARPFAKYYRDPVPRTPRVWR